MAPGSLLFAVALLASGSLAQTTTASSTVNVLFPGGANSTDVLRASMVTVNPATQETIYMLACGETSSFNCDFINRATYRTSPGGAGINAASNGTSTRVISGVRTTTTLVLSIGYELSITCNQTSGTATCDFRALASVVSGNTTTTITKSRQSVYTNPASFTAPLTVTAGLQLGSGTSGSPTSSSSSGSVPRPTGNAAIAGAVAFIGGAAGALMI